MPGFIDFHTHYDAEVELAPSLSESVRHGVTTVVLGSCSLSLALGTPEDLADMFCRVEAIPYGTVRSLLEERKRWNTLGEYLEHLDSLPGRGSGEPRGPGREGRHGGRSPHGELRRLRAVGAPQRCGSEGRPHLRPRGGAEWCSDTLTGPGARLRTRAARPVSPYWGTGDGPLKRRRRSQLIGWGAMHNDGGLARPSAKRVDAHGCVRSHTTHGHLPRVQWVQTLSWTCRQATSGVGSLFPPRDVRPGSYARFLWKRALG
jgi:hypothetical protein